MADDIQPKQYKNLTVCNEATLSFKFIVVSVLVFFVGLSATAYFCRSMSGGMEMPGGWTMSMMWMPMSGQTLVFSAISFLLMWLAMMVAMMMPSAFPMFLRIKRQWVSLCCMASGYFAIWLAAGFVIYVFGVAFAAVAIRSEFFSHAVPLLSVTLLFIAGAIQFAPWKMTHLLQCRSPFGCDCSCLQHEISFWLGCKQGVSCCVCCAAPMIALLVLGMMNPFVIIAVAIVIAAEKLLPRPEIIVRLVGISAIIAGLFLSVVFLQSSWHASSTGKSSKVMGNMT